MSLVERDGRLSSSVVCLLSSAQLFVRASTGDCYDDVLRPIARELVMEADATDRSLLEVVIERAAFAELGRSAVVLAAGAELLEHCGEFQAIGTRAAGSVQAAIWKATGPCSPWAIAYGTIRHQVTTRGAPLA